jgi:hypothetical protein
MNSLTLDTETWIGQVLSDGDHHRVGTIEEIYYDEQSDRATWMVVKTGRLGAKRVFVPTASTVVARDAVVTVYAKREIEEAPRIDAVDELPEDRLRDLYRHYGLHYDAPGDGAGCPTPAERVLAYLM